MHLMTRQELTASHDFKLADEFSSAKGPSQNSDRDGNEPYRFFAGVQKDMSLKPTLPIPVSFDSGSGPWLLKHS